MSNLFQEGHQTALNFHIEKNKTEFVNKNHRFFARRKDGYVIPIYLYVSIFPYFQNHLLYTGIIRPIHSFDEYIVLLPNGIIDSFSERVGRKLKLNPYAKKRYSLRYICPAARKTVSSVQFYAQRTAKQP